MSMLMLKDGIAFSTDPAVGKLRFHPQTGIIGLFLDNGLCIRGWNCTNGKEYSMQQFDPFPPTNPPTVPGPGEIPRGGNTPTPTTPIPTAPVPVPPGALPPGALPPGADGHFDNVRYYYNRGDPRGVVLSNFYLETSPAVPFKAGLQDRVRDVLLGGSQSAYAYWADPRSYNEANAYPMSDAEFAEMIARAKAVPTS